jgi:hypothetical protein
VTSALPVSVALAPILFDDFDVGDTTNASGEEIDSEEICSLAGLAVLEPACAGEFRGDRMMTRLGWSADMEGVAGALSETRGAGRGEPLFDTEGSEDDAFFGAKMALKSSSSKP